MPSLTSTDVLIVELGARVEGQHVNKAAALALIETCSRLAADLRELHEHTGISLDKWYTARTFVEAFTGPVEDNHA